MLFQQQQQRSMSVETFENTVSEELTLQALLLVCSSFLLLLKKICRSNYSLYYVLNEK